MGTVRRKAGMLRTQDQEGNYPAAEEENKKESENKTERQALTDTAGNGRRRKLMSMPFEPEEIDDLDEILLEEMDQEDMEEFREQLLETLDGMMALEPDPDLEEEDYYEWEDRINILHDMIDAIETRMS